MTDTESVGQPRRIGILTTDLDLVVKSWDAALERMTGISTQQATGQRLDAIVPDLTTRVPAELLRQPLQSGSVQVLAPALHKFLIPCAPTEPSQEFDRMQQRVVVGALLDGQHAVGLVVTIEDVTARLERERQLARQLRDGDANDRLLAIHRLAELEPADDLGPIAGALDDADWQVRRTAVRALAARRDAPLVDAVIAALSDGHHNFGLLSSALQLLSLTGVDVTDALVGLMAHADAAVRMQAALALGGQKGPQAIDALIAAFDDPDVNVRFHAIEAIGQQAHPAAIDRLADIAAADDFFLAFAAVAALVRIGDPLAAARLAALLDNEMLAAAAAEALGHLGDEEAVTPLTQALGAAHLPVEPIVEALARIHQRYQTLFAGAVEIEDRVGRAISAAGTARILDALPGASGDTLKQLVVVLGWIRDPGIPIALAQLLGSSDVRNEVIAALVRFGAAASTPLIDRLDSADLEAKRAAIVALGRLGDARATANLAALLDSEDERELWVPICGALARLGDGRAFETLISRLGDEDAAVRQAAIGALNSIGHPATGARIAALIDDPNPSLRESAVRIAGYFGYNDCTERAVARCHDQDEAVRAAALEHLPYFESPVALDVLASALADDTPRARAAAAQALGSMRGDRAQRMLAQALTDPEPWVRYFAAIGLGRHGDVAALDALVALAHTDPAGQVAVAAIEAVAAIGGDTAVVALAALAESAGDRGQTAIRSLGRIPSDRAVDALRHALQAGDSPRRLLAVAALAAQATPEAVDVLRWTSAADADSAVARASITALRDVANLSAGVSQPAVAALVDTLRNPAHRGDALDALARLAPSAIPHLADEIEASDPYVRRGVVEALGRLSHPAASACLRRALSDQDAVVRRTAITALARVGARGLSAELAVLAQNDPAPSVRQAASAALHRSLDDGNQGAR